MIGAGTVERAFLLAPECGSVDELKARLKREGCSNVEAHLSGGSIRADLKRLLNLHA